MGSASAIIALIELLAGTAGKLLGGKIGTDVAIGTDLLTVAQQALLLQSQISGVPIDQVIVQLHDLPPITLPPVSG